MSVKGGELFTLGGLQAGKRFRDGVFERGKCLWIEPCDRLENVVGEAAIVRTTFDDSPAGGRSQSAPFVEKAPSQQFTEQGADTHAGEKVAVAPDLAGFAGVVTQFGLVQGQGHEIGEAQRTVALDPFAQNRSQ